MIARYLDSLARLGFIALPFALWTAYRLFSWATRAMPRPRVIWMSRKNDAHGGQGNPPAQAGVTAPLVMPSVVPPGAAPYAPSTALAAAAPAMPSTVLPGAALATPSTVPPHAASTAPIAASSTAAPSRPSSGDAAVRLARGFDAAMARLDKGGPWWRLGRASPYRLPWYVVLGAEGSGKSALLRAAGLAYECDDRTPGAEPGDPCRWWIADEAVLLEMALPHEPDGHAAGGMPDHGVWQAFLRRLRNVRRRCAINGVIVTIAAGALLGDADGPHWRAAALLRSRLKDMRASFGVHFPVYVVVTQCDRVAGFRAYFGDLDAARRARVFGLTLPVAAPADLDDAQGVKNLPAMCQDLARRLQARMLRALGRPAPLDTRAEIYAFPVQFDLLAREAARFLADVFADSPPVSLPWLRGVYFTSAEQAPGPVRAQRANPLAMAMQEATPGAPAATSSRSYFAARLLRDLVLAESGLAFRRPAALPESRWLRRGAPAAVLLCALAFCVRVGLGVRADASFMADMDRKSALLAARAGHGVDPDQPGAMLPLLDAAGELAAAPPRIWPMPWIAPGRPAVRLADAGRARYLAVLRRTLVPLVARQAIQAAGDTGLDAARRYAALRVYLMLGTPRVYESATVLAWIQGQAERLLPGRAQRQDFMAHARALFGSATYSPHIALDQARVNQARAQLIGYSTLDRVYQDILRQLTRLVPGTVSVASMGGVNAPLALARTSGRWLTDGVPGAYTPQGYRHYLALRDAALRDISKEVWVLGTDGGALADMRRAALKEDLDKLYFHRYISAWDDLLDDLRLVPLSRGPGGVWLIKMLADSDSPLRQLLETAAAQTTLRGIAAAPGSATAPPVRDPTRGEISGVSAPAHGSARGKTSPAPPDDPAGASGGPAAVPPGDNDGDTEVDRHFQALHRLFQAGPDGSAPSMDDVQAALKEAAVYLDAVQAARQRGLPLPPGDALDKLRQLAEVQPEPLRQLLRGLSANGDTLALGSERQRLNDLWRPSAAFCHAALDHRYPLDRYATVDATPDDFARVLGPGGLMDNFFQANLLPYVDTATRPWRWRADGGAPKLSEAALRAFERAATIRQAFFADGGKSPSVRFQLAPVSLDAGILRFTLALNDKTLEYAHGPVRPTEFQWPGTDGTQSVRMAYETGDGGGDRAFSIDGPWALFRLLDRGTLTRVRADRYALDFDLGGRGVALRLDASSVINPFELDALRDFRCPDAL